jgi:outer membrane protein assembly factor BamB
VTSDYVEDGLKRDWTIFRGSPSLSGYVECDIPASPKLLWSRTVQSRTVAAPIVYDGWIYTLDRKGRLRRFSPEGDSMLVHDFQTAIEASFVVDDSMLYVGRIDGYVNAFSLNRQQVAWDFETLGQISGSPNLVGDQLLVGSYDGSMYTLDNKTGRKTGQFETGYYINGTAAVWKNNMMFGGCDAWVRVVDIATGTQTDSLELDSYVPASPAILDGVACACDYNGNVYEMTLENGKIASHRKLLASSADNEGQDGGVVSMPTLTHSDVYILSGDRYISCINRASGQVRWKKMLHGMTGECSPLVAQDKVLVCTKDGYVSIYDSKDGTELWHYEAGEQIIASPAIIGDRFYILTSRGTLMCFGEN